MARFVVGLSLAFCLCAISVAQSDPAAGILPFSTQVGGTIDSVDLATGSITLQIPIRNKAGKVPFSYSLLGGSHAFIYTFDQNGVYKQFWSVGTGLLVGVPFSGSLGATVPVIVQSNQTCDPGQGDTVWSISNVVDATGAAHPMPYPGTEQWDTGTCHNPKTQTYTTADGSGYTITGTVSNSGAFSVTLYDRSGNVVGGPILSTTSTDPDGVTMSGPAPGYSGTYTDTLGTTAMTSTLNRGLNGASDTYVYKDASGTQRTATVGYTKYSLKTAFDCGSIVEIDEPSAYLPSTISLPTGGSYELSYEPTPDNSGYVTGRIQTITLPSGGTVTYGYSGGSNNSGMNCSSAVVPTLTRTVNDNNGNSGTWTYVNSNPGGASPQNYTVTETDPSGNQTIHYFSGEYQTQAVYKQGSGTVLKTLITCYGSKGLAPPSMANCAAPSTTPTLPITETDVYASQGTSAYNEVQTKIDGTYGNITYTAMYDYGATTPTVQVDNYYGSWSGSSCSAIGNNINDKVCAKETFDGSSNLQAETRFTYNTGGHPVTTSSWVSGSAWLTTTAVFNATGTLSSTYDPAGNKTSYTYSAPGNCGVLLPTGTILPTANGITMTTAQTWDCNGGVVTSSTDANGSQTTYSYTANGADPLYRLKSVTRSNGQVISYSYNTGSSWPWSTSTSTNIDSGLPTVSTTTMLDGLGRAVLKSAGELSSSSDPANTITGLVYGGPVYNALGQVAQAYNPYYSSSDPTYGYTSYTYDALGRPTLVTLPDNDSITTEYSNQTVVSYPEGNGGVTFLRYDGLGRLATVCEYTNSTQANGDAPIGSGCNPEFPNYSAFKTSYSWDPLSRLTGVNQSSQIRSYSYDGLSRLTSETNPEQNSNGHAGQIIYTYNATTGDLYQRTSPIPNGTTGSTTASTYAYDVLHRLTGITYSDSYTNPKRYFWDVSTWSTGSQKGRMVREDTGPCGGPPDCSGKIFWYDVDGNATETETWAHVGGPAVYTTATFNLADEPKTYEDISGSVYTTTYDSIGRPMQLSSTRDDSMHPNPLYTVNSFNAFGEQVTALFGNGVTRTNGYDHRGRLISRVDVNAGTNVYSESIGYATTGLVSSITDSVNGTVAYTYDNFRRLLTADCSANCQNGTNNENYTFAYDEFGNVWSQTISGSGMGITYSNNFDRYNHITPATCANLNTVCYDNAGNKLYNGDGTHQSFDTEGKIWSYGDQSGQTASYVWDAASNRIERTVNGVLLDYVDGTRTEGGLSAGNINTIDLRLGGVHVNTYVGSATTFFNHQDHLGISRRQTDPTGSPNSSFFETLPFGEWNGNNMQGNDLFAGDSLLESGDSYMYQMPYRRYDEYTGQWQSPDPAGMAAVEITNPQSWNRYSYATNNPVSFADPTGLYRCAYLNDAGDGVESVDQNSSPDECRDTGGSEDTNDPSDYNTIIDVTATLTAFDDASSYSGDNTGAANNFVVMTLPPNAQACSTNAGVNFNAPPGFSVSNIAANGKTNGLTGAGAAVGQGGYYDFQRRQVGSTTQFFPGYTPVANIAVGAYLQGTGVPQWMASAISNTYAFFKSSNGATAQQAQFRNLGFSLASGKGTYSCHPQHP